MLKKITKILLNSALALLIGIGVLAVFSYLPIPGNFKILTVQSGSMEPAIKVGSLIIIKPSNNYKIGDIVTKKTNDPKVTITHRIINLEDNNGLKTFETKGDANNISDKDKIPKEMIVGKVLFDIPLLGYPVGYAKTSKGLFFVIIIPALIIILDELFNIHKELVKRKDYKQRVDKRKEKDNKNIDSNDNEEEL